MKMMSMVELTPEGKIVRALIEGPKSYSELRSATGLSDRWLSLKLREMREANLIERVNGRYLLRDLSLIEVDPLFASSLREEDSLRTKAKLIAHEMSKNEGVLAVILFGSLAKGKASEESDIDLLIITEGVEIEESLYDRIYDLMFKYDVPIDAIFMTLDDLLMNLAMKTSFLLGVLSGYEVLFDREGIRALLSVGRRFLRDWVYDEEAGAWIQRRLMSTSKRQEVS